MCIQASRTARCRILLVLLVLLFVLGNLTLAAVPYEITTPQGRYLIVELPGLENEFELTGDHKYAVVHTSTKYQVISVSDGQPLGEPLVTQDSQWKILGQELYIGRTTSWDVYSLPKLEKLRSIDLPWTNDLIDKQAQWGPLRALVHGWYCNGWVLSDDLSKPLANLREPSSYWQCADHIEAYARKSRESSIPVDIKSVGNQLILANYDTLPVVGPDKGTFTGHSDGAQFRFGPDWFTIQGNANREFVEGVKTQGVYVKLLGKHFGNRKYPKSLHWWPHIPMVLDKDSDLSKWKLMLIPQMIEADSVMTISPGPQDMIDHTLNRHPNRLVGILNSYPLDKLDENLTKYLAEAGREFELVSGRKPTHIPLAFTVSFADEFLYHPSKQIVWTEITKAELITRYGPDLLKIDANTKLQAAEERNRSLLYQRSAAIQQINEENARKLALSKKFQFNFKSYAGYFGMIVAFMAIAAACTYYINRRAKLEPNDTVSQPPEPNSEPPIISPAQQSM